MSSPVSPHAGDSVVQKVCSHQGDSESRRAVASNNKGGNRVDSGLGSIVSESPGACWKGKMWPAQTH